jgi:hypothetical protein
MPLDPGLRQTPPPTSAITPHQHLPHSNRVHETGQLQLSSASWVFRRVAAARTATQTLAALSGYAAFPILSRTCVRYAGTVGTWHDLNVGRPIAAPLERCAELLGVDLATVHELAAKVDPYLRADGTRIWSLMQLERQLRPEAYGRRRGGYLDRRRTPTADA